jgi:hypothetical protein
MSGIDKDTFKQIFHDHWGTFKAVYPQFDTPDYDIPVQKMLDCGDPERMGFVQYRCLNCGETSRIAFTCKSNFCLSCAYPHTTRWSDFIGRRLLPGVTYRHFVLTVPEFLRHYFYQNAHLLGQLMRTGDACLRDVLGSTARVSLQIGCIMVLQTFGRSGHFNPHVHVLVTAGGLTPQGTWKSLSFIPYELLHKKWQYYLLTMLRQHADHPCLAQEIDRGWKDYPKGFVAYLQPGNVPPGGKGLAQYLAKYVVSPPISIRRIERYDGTTVRYWYEDHQTQAIQHETLPVLRFIGRMVQHILPKGFQRIRYYGLHSNIRYETIRNQLPQVLPRRLPDDPRGFRVLPRKPFQRLFEEFCGRDPLLCPRCHTPMVWELMYHPEYGILKEEQLLDFEAPHERLLPQPRLPGLGETNAPGAPLGGTASLVQIPLPFL